VDLEEVLLGADVYVVYVGVEKYKIVDKVFVH
jgi:hypothetical protein